MSRDDDMRGCTGIIVAFLITGGALALIFGSEISAILVRLVEGQ